MYQSVFGFFHYILLTGVVLATAGIGVAMLSLRAPGMYWLGTLVVFEALITVYVTFLAISNLLSVWMLTAVAGCGFALSVFEYSRRGYTFSKLWGRLYTHFRSLWAIISSSRPLSVLSLVLSFVGCWFVFIAFLLPPTSYDSLWYHLPPVVDWIQQGHFGTIAHLRPNYPKNVEVLVLWNTIFTHNQTLMRFTQLFFLPVGFVSVYVLAREMDLSVENALLSGFVFVSTPLVLIQSVTTYVDLGVAALTLAATASLLRYLNDPEYPTLLIFGVSTGLLLGSKTSGLVFAGVLFLGFIYVLARTDSHDLFDLSILVSSVGMLVVLLGGYWYIRNIIIFGNPIYPLAIDFAGIDVLNGPVPISERQDPWSGRVVNIHGPASQFSFIERMYLSWFEKIGSYSFAPRIGGFGPQWSILALPSIVILIYFSLKKKMRSYLFILTLFLLPLFVLPAYKTRFTIYLVGIGAVSIGFVRGRVVRNSRQFDRILLTLLILSAVMATGLRPTKYPGYVDRSLSNFNERSSMLVSAHTTTPIEHENLFQHVPAGSRIGIRLQSPDLAFNLYDKNLQNRLVYLRKTEDSAGFEAAVERHNVNYLVLYKDSKQANWAQNMTNTNLIYSNNRYYLFQVE